MDGKSMIIILFGRTGAGKSSLLEDIANVEGHATDNEGEDVVTQVFQLEQIEIGGKQYIIMDTRGFDAGTECDAFHELVRGIQAIRENIGNWALLYVTTINTSRYETIDQELLQFAESLCGDNFAPHITFVTTHWTVHYKKEERKLNDRFKRQNERWIAFMDRGARTYQHGREYSDGKDTGNFLDWHKQRPQIAQNARDMIVRHYGNVESLAPLIVRELGDRCPTHRTTAGAFLEPAMQDFSPEQWTFADQIGREWNDFNSETRKNPRLNTTYMEKDMPRRSFSPPESTSPDASSPVDEPQPGQSSAGSSSESWFTWLQALAENIPFEFTANGPIVGVRNGTVSVNGRSGAKMIWEALCSDQNPDPSIINFLDSNGLPSDIESRRALAAQFGVDPASIGSAEGNTELLELLRSLGRRG